MIVAFLIEGKKPSKTKGKASQVKVAKAKIEQTSMQKDKKQRKKRAQRGQTKAKKAKDNFNAMFDDDFSYSCKSLYSLPYTPFILSLSLFSTF